MKREILQRAQALADRPYKIEVSPDEADGQLWFTAVHPDLPGCRGAGRTVQEAIADLADARVDLIASLLEDGLPVPEPAFAQSKQ